MTQLRWVFLISVVWASFVSLPTRAEEPTVREPEVITNKFNTTRNRFELSLFPYDTTFRNLYVQHTWAMHAAVGYHIFDWLAVEGFGGYVFKNSDTVTTTILRSVSEVKDFELAGLWRTAWFGGANLLWAPLYGKFSLFSELEGNFQIYALLGGGIDGIERPNATGSMVKSTRITGNVGAGLRFFFTRSLALRAELRESLGKNSYLSGEQGEILGSTWVQLGVSLFL